SEGSDRARPGRRLAVLQLTPQSRRLTKAARAPRSGGFACTQHFRASADNTRVRTKHTRLLLLGLLAGGCAHAPAWDPQHPTAEGPPAPRLGSPSADDHVTAARPTFSWHLPAGVAAGVLE